MSSVHAAVLALQGSVEPHLRSLHASGVDPIEVRKPEQLAGVTHLIIPGGESTTLHHLFKLHGLDTLISDRVKEGSLALLGTCAGAILMGHHPDQAPPRLGLIDVDVDRNAYGRQVHSFVDQVEWNEGPGPGTSEGVFIRAPRFTRIGDSVNVLARRENETVAVQQNRCIACCFHPELTTDPRLHRWFLGL
ncbi:MAG: pyridoxal 5'-phosphate synthase glutaminase subunit PdxT [Planctomycetia bacterium]|nr:pyridoxal 5'-phosphate synthase glutaminase subunit PdxT [Planctomycetia bacterium]MBL6914010.1 pyridoxal 5'-phosphate synthase glutaminase subunit PdxT [Planctomycetota bacterium]HCW44969.1 pyridoxal 5'-phosphate synthase glutaminase subunit PdxT [Planctomycetota bacterium]